MVSRDNDTTCTTSLAPIVLRIRLDNNLKNISALHQYIPVGCFNTGHALHLASSPNDFSVTPANGLAVLFGAQPCARKTHEI